MAPALLNHRVEGDGPPLLLVHGWGVSFTIWRDLAPLLKPHYTLIIPELPGIGASPMPGNEPYYEASASALEALRQALGISRWSLLGYSMGGWAVRAYVRRYPQVVERCIFLCIPRPLPPAALGLRLLADLDHAWPEFGDWLVSAWRLRMLVALLGFNGLSWKMARLWSSEIESQPAWIVKETLRTLPGYGRAPLDLPEVPTHFIWGRSDLLGAAPLRAKPGEFILTGGHDLPMSGASRVAAALQQCMPPGR
jgi:pimeloyl-ACP methyl ester carboxylesterase